MPRPQAARLWIAVFQELLICDFGNQLEIMHLCFEVLFSTTKPETLTCATVNAQWSPDGVAIPARPQPILLGEDLDSFSLPARLDRDTQP
jgi:hypothetical protein